MNAPYIGAVAKLATTAGGAAARQCLGFLIKALAKAENVRLVFGTQARTDGKTVELPHLPYKASAELVEMVVGILFHEVLHIRYSDFNIFVNEVKAASNPSLMKGIANALEDPRIEAVEKKVRPHYVARIFNARQHASNLGFARKPDTEANALLVYITLWGHVGNGMLHAKPAFDEADQALRKRLGNTVVDDLQLLLQVGFPRLRSTADVIALSKQVISLLQSAASPPPSSNPADSDQDEEAEEDESNGAGETEESSSVDSEAEAEGDQDQSDEPSSGESGAEGSDADGGQDLPDDSQSDEPEADGSDAQGDQDQSDEPSSGESGAEGSDTEGDQGESDDPSSDHDGSEGGSGASPDAHAEAAQRLLESEVMNPGAAHTDLSAALQQEADKSLSQHAYYEPTTGSVGELGKGQLSGQDHDAYARLRAEALAESELVKRHFMVLMTRARSRRLEARSTGRIRPGKFVLATMGAKPFGRRTESLVRETVVELLVDVSGSMCEGRKALVAAQAAVAVVEACTAARLPVGVAAFGDNSYYRLKGFDQILGDAHGGLGMLPTLPDGGTPLGEAIEQSAIALLSRPEARKMMFCVTDGLPNDREHVRAMLEGLEGVIECVGVGIGGHSCNGLFDRSLTVHRIDELGEELIDYLRKRIVVTRTAA